MAGNNS